MNYLMLAYGVVGLTAYLWYAPRYLRRKEVGSKGVGWTALSILFADISGLLVLVAALLIWPVAVPVWIWFEIDAKQQKERDADISRREREAKASDRYYGMSLEQKLGILAQKAGETRPEESNRVPGQSSRHG